MSSAPQELFPDAPGRLEASELDSAGEDGVDARADSLAQDEPLGSTALLRALGHSGRRA